MPEGCIILCLPNKTLSLSWDTCLLFRIFAVVRQTRGNYTLSRQMKPYVLSSTLGTIFS